MSITSNITPNQQQQQQQQPEEVLPERADEERSRKRSLEERQRASRASRTALWHRGRCGAIPVAPEASGANNITCCQGLLHCHDVEQMRLRRDMKLLREGRPTYERLSGLFSNDMMRDILEQKGPFIITENKNGIKIMQIMKLPGMSFKKSKGSRSTDDNVGLNANLSLI